MDLEQLHKQMKGRQLAAIEIDIGDEMHELVIIEPGFLQLRRFTREVAIKGLGRAVNNMAAELFQKQLAVPFKELDREHPMLRLRINQEVMEYLGVDTIYEDVLDEDDHTEAMALICGETFTEIHWRRILPSERDRMLNAINKDAMSAMQKLLKSIVQEPDEKAFSAYLAEQPGRILALYNAIADRSGMGAEIKIKKLSGSRTETKSKSTSRGSTSKPSKASEPSD